MSYTEHCNDKQRNPLLLYSLVHSVVSTQYVMNSVVHSVVSTQRGTQRPADSHQGRVPEPQTVCQWVGPRLDVGLAVTNPP